MTCPPPWIIRATPKMKINSPFLYNMERMFSPTNGEGLAAVDVALRIIYIS
jgi:hypothetical protein